jgi:Spy/CpxP family protein refolding chaperone
MAYAFDGVGGRRSVDKLSKQKLLPQLPAEKEMLFYQTTREAREKNSAMRSQTKQLRREIKEILTADQFDEDLFREKTSSLEALHQEKHKAMQEAIITLAKQFTAEEREILVQLLPGKRGHGRRAPGQRNH